MAKTQEKCLEKRNVHVYITRLALHHQIPNVKNNDVYYVQLSMAL